MQAFADFSDNLLGGIVLLALSLAVGGMVWGIVVLRPWRRRAGDALVRRCLTLVAAGAASLTLVQTGVLVLKALVLSGYVGGVTASSLLETLQFRAGLARALLALGLAVAAARLARSSGARAGWAAIALLAAATAASGAWLVHAAGRLEHRVPLMVLTTLHQAAAAVWVGGIIQLGAAWRLTRRDPALAVEWPALVSRFSRIGVGSVVGLALTAAPLLWVYVGSWRGLVGTGYGSLILTKALLMGVALVLAAVNFTVARRWRRGQGAAPVHTAVPSLVETEAILLVILLFAAASLSSQPPAVDTEREWATWAEVAEVFRPKWPDLTTPSVATMLQDPSNPIAVIGGERTNAAYSWSNFSHNVSGLFLLTMSLLALAGRGRLSPLARHWPLGFVALAVFVFLRTSGDAGVWPLGPKGFWRVTLGDPEVLQHRLAALLVLVIGLLEWRARRSGRGTPLPYLFPALGAVGGILLLTHAHSAFEPKSSYLIQVTHTVMGALAVLMTAARWLELRLSPPAARVAGAASMTAMLLIALVLVFYLEANVVVPR